MPTVVNITPYTPEDQCLLSCLKAKQERLCEQIAAGRPYVWELRLSLKEFEILEQNIAASISSHSNDYHHLLSEDFALVVVIYLAEWYKRFYKGSDTMDENKVLSLNTEELKKLYQLAGIDTNTFVYNASKNPDKTSFRWLESLQVLGGLAVQAELKRDESDPLLPRLCKIFHGEEIELDDLKDRNRAVAFQESIARQHSLYDYLDCILSKEKEAPFHKDDVRNEETCIPQLLSRIKEADYRAKKHKFDFEWIITYSHFRNQMVRHLRVKLKPEEIGGGKKQYIGYDRLRREDWGIEHPENVGRICFYLSFKNGGQYVQKFSSSDEPLFKYDNTGSEYTGFLSVNKIDENTFTDVPVCHFDKVEMVMRYTSIGSDGQQDIHTRIVQELEVKDYMQLYALPKTSNKFSTRRNSQSVTVVLFSSAYRLSEPFADLPVVHAHFRNGNQCSEDYCWCSINDKLILLDPDGKEILPPFFNRNGLYQVVTKKYLKTIKYKENVYVLYQYIDIDYDEEQVQTEEIPVLFGRSGLEVRHYATGQAKDGVPVTDYELEWMKNGRYVDWNKEEPLQGAIRLRVTVKGIVFTPKVYYVPFTPQANIQDPIWRDFEHQRICSALEGVEDIQDDFKKLLDQKEPDTKELVIGNENSRILIDVYRPIIVRELSQEDSSGVSKIVSYSGKDEDIHIPLLNCNQFSLRDFSENGVKEYKLLSNNSMYYHFPTFNSINLSADNYRLELKASDVIDVPLDYLKIYISRAVDAPKCLFAWNYKDEPQKVANTDGLKEDGIVFQSMLLDSHPRHYAMPYIKKVISGWGRARSQVVSDPIFCFETASEHGLYYFMVNPLIRLIQSGNQISDLILPLIKKRNFNLSDDDVKRLLRFAVQFHFDWMLLPREKWLSAIAAITSDEEDAQKYKTAIVDFFRQTDKCSDEREKYCLEEFLKNYWNFNAIPSKLDRVADSALQLILDKPDALRGFDNLKELLKVYDSHRFKFSEMSHALVTNDNE